MELLAPVLTLSSLGLLFGLGLALAARRFCVVTDPRVEKVLSKLPGANCGACGLPGCMRFAQGLLSGECNIENCRVTGEQDRKELAELLGVEIKKTTKKIARLNCQGGNQVKDRFLYVGIKDCLAANLLMRGQKACIYGCLGFGSCVRVCPFDVIKMGEEGLPIVDVEKCKACGKCVEICPKNLYTLLPQDSSVYVACSSYDIGKKVKDVCAVGCIACKRCQDVCPVGAIEIINNLARIDYNKCTSCGKCIETCPTKCIIMLELKGSR